MNWSLEILQLEADYNKKIAIFRMYLERGLAYIDQKFPAYHAFILENANKTTYQVEQMLCDELEEAKHHLA